MSNPIENLKKAKEMLDMGLIESSEYNAIKFNVMNAMGMVSKESSPVAAHNQLSPNPNRNQLVQTVGQYRVIRLIGEGGMGQVYEVAHKNPQIAQAQGRRALKLLRSEFAHNQVFHARFVAEAVKGIKLEHLHIAKVYEFIDEGGLLGLVMEYVDGKTLEEMDEDNEEDQEEMQEGEVVGGLGESEDGETKGVGSLQYTLQIFVQIIMYI